MWQQKGTQTYELQKCISTSKDKCTITKTVEINDKVVNLTKIDCCKVAQWKEGGVQLNPYAGNTMQLEPQTQSMHLYALVPEQIIDHDLALTHTFIA